MPTPLKTVADIWAQVVIAGSNECWLWNGYRDKDGYGRTCYNRKKHVVTRLIFAFTHGRDPVGLVCHTCDNPSCCNPAHLYDGDHEQNALDSVARGRAKYKAHHGTDNGFSKLKEQEVMDIRWLADNGATHKQIAGVFRVSAPLIHYIATRKYWRHVPEAA